MNRQLTTIKVWTKADLDGMTTYQYNLWSECSAIGAWSLLGFPPMWTWDFRYDEQTQTWILEFVPKGDLTPSKHRSRVVGRSKQEASTDRKEGQMPFIQGTPPAISKPGSAGAGERAGGPTVQEFLDSGLDSAQYVENEGGREGEGRDPLSIKAVVVEYLKRHPEVPVTLTTRSVKDDEDEDSEPELQLWFVKGENKHAQRLAAKAEKAEGNGATEASTDEDGSSFDDADKAFAE